MTKGPFAEIPPDIPDWEFRGPALEEREKDLSKKRKKETKLKGKTSVIDGTPQKASKADIVKAGETLPGEGEEISTAAQVKGKKGTELSEVERGSLQKAPSAVSEKLPKQPGKSEIVRNLYFYFEY